MSNRVMWPFRVNWRDRYEVQLSYRTDIFTASAGRETRSACRPSPRKSLSFTASLPKDDLLRFNRLLSTAQNMLFVMPEVTRRVGLAAALSGGGTALTLAGPAPAWLRQGGELVVGSGTAARVASIEGVSGSTVTIDEPIGAFAAGTPAFHALTGRLASELDASRATTAVAQARVAFSVDPGSEAAPVDDQVPTLGGRERFGWRHNWADAQEVTQLWPVATLDYDAGRIAVTSPIDFPTQRRSAAVLLSGNAMAEQLVAQFCRMRGKRGEMLRPTDEYDMTAVAAVTAGGSQLTVEGAVYDTFLADPVHQAVSIRIGGVTYDRIITGMTKVGSNTVLALHQALPVAGVPDRISWLYAVRFEQDDLVLSWVTDTVAIARVATRTLPFAGDADFTALRATPAGEDRITPEGDQRAVLYLDAAA